MQSAVCVISAKGVGNCSLSWSATVSVVQESMWWASDLWWGVKGVVDCFFSRLDCVYRVQSSMCSCLFFFFKRIIFHIIYLYSTPLCPFSDKRLDLFPGFMKLLLQKYAMGWDWLAGSVCCDSLNRLYCTSERPAPHLSGMCSGWIVNSGVVYNAYQFEPDWDPEVISEEDCAEPVQAQLLIICLVVVVSYF